MLCKMPKNYWTFKYGRASPESHMKGKKHFQNAYTIQCFFRPTKKANDSNEIFTVHIPNSSQIQINETEETQQLTLLFVSKSSPSKKKTEILFTLKSDVSN